jgi:hypothetical protein
VQGVFGTFQRALRGVPGTDLPVTAVGLLLLALGLGLYRTHPWAPVLVIDALVSGGFYLLGSVLVGSGTVRLRRRSREGARGSWLTGLGRRFG